MKKVRCAIYTRKSSEEGLEQDFNSLHAQREACAAYILSQASEGWSLLDEEYDDGGLSGGTLKRPALRRLLADIEAGKIDTVVVYKVDRLTRSLIDFAKLVETMDEADVSFVSVTQSFNTTNSMGRLTLNMLLSFAQFEREVTAERIRDKIAASKAKGMWMGGIVPLGYEADGRTLRIVEEHAGLIRQVFARYLETRNVRLLTEALAEEDTCVPERTTNTGRILGGKSFTRGQIYRLLSNPIYLGEIHHKGAVYDGRHDAIVDRTTWDEVQTVLAANKQGEETKTKVKSPSLLTGLVQDHTGAPLIASHACKGKQRYRYYVSKTLQQGASEESNGCRMPALELEKAVCEALASEFDHPLALLDKAGITPSAGEISVLGNRAGRTATKLRKRDRGIVRRLAAKIVVQADRLAITLPSAELADALGIAAISDLSDVTISMAASLTRTGKVVRLVQADGRTAAPSEPQPHLLKLLHRARSWWSEMTETGVNVTEMAKRHEVTPSYVTRLIRLNFLSPAIVQKIATGTASARIDAKMLLGLSKLPLDWSAQEKLLLPG